MLKASFVHHWLSSK